MDAQVGLQPGTSRVVTLKSGRRLGVAQFGDPDGIPVIALHGAPASRLMFDVAESHARAAGLRLIAFDRPGYGLSPLDYGANLSSRTETFAELPEALGIERCAILGISGGAPYAVALAARLGRQVTALGLVSPIGPVADLVCSGPDALQITTAHRWFFIDLPRHPWVLRLNAEITARSFRLAPKFFASMFLHVLPKADREILERPDVQTSMIDMTMEATRHGISGGVADLEIYGEPWHVNYGTLTAPTRLWQGTADNIVPSNVACKLAELIPNCSLTKVDGAGHFWIYNAIADVLAELRALAMSAS